MRSHSMPDVEIVNQLVVPDPKIVERDISGEKMVKSPTEFLRASEKAAKINTL